MDDKNVYNSNLFIDKIVDEIKRRFNNESIESALEYASKMIELKEKTIKSWTNTYNMTDKTPIKKKALTRIKNDTEAIELIDEFINRFKEKTKEGKMVR